MKEEPAKEPRRRGRTVARYSLLLLGNVAVLMLVLVFIEGVASYAVVLRQAMRVTQVAERRHTMYDPEIGWVNEPNVDIPDMYGPGVSLRTNSQGFRSSQEFEPTVAPGRARLICSGDSFTFGYGVDNEQTWCHLLTILDPRLESVNMGLGSYGVGQAFLSYRRDAAELDHQINILAFITGDFYRLRAPRLYGYSKPVLEVDGDELVVTNVPVPEPMSRLTWLQNHARRYARRLRTTEVLRTLLAKVRRPPAPVQDMGQNREAEIRVVLSKVLEQLNELNRQRSSQLVLVYLPLLSELEGDDVEEWREFVERTSRSLGLLLIDTFPAFRALSSEDRLSMYIPEGQIDYTAAAGHFSRKGNEFVASLIHEAMAEQGVVDRASLR